MTTLHINALIYGLMLSLLQAGLAYIWAYGLLPQLRQWDDLGAVELIIGATLPIFFSPVYALSQVVKKFAGINGNGHKKAEGVPYD